jgi:DNA-binding HxlR family transcriptional regulator
MSPSVLSQRLSELTEAGILEAASGGAYALTPRGHDLLPALDSLNTWARGWATAADRRDSSEAGA